MSLKAHTLDTPAAQHPQPLLRLEGLTKRFGDLTVLDGLDLELHRGHTTVLMGPSGTGKSVLLKHVVGLLEPDAGRVVFDGTALAGLTERQLRPLRCRMGFLFQMSALFDSMTIGENVAFPLLQHRRGSADERAQLVAQKLAMVGLAGLESRMPSELSGGMRKRAALARAIALDPELILYDEPTTGLDPQRADVINTLINRLRQQLGVTSLVVTHDVVCAARVADRVVVLMGGKLCFDGSYNQLLECTDPRVRAFVEGRANPEDLRGLSGEVFA